MVSNGAGEGVTWIGLGTWGGRSGFWGAGGEEFSFGQRAVSGHIRVEMLTEKVKKVMKTRLLGRHQGGRGDLRVLECGLLEGRWWKLLEG